MAGERILVVEPEKNIAEDLKATLQGFGYEVIDIAINGEMAIEKSVTLLPDLIIMDSPLSGPIDGISAARKILSLINTPIVFFAAHTQDIGIIQKEKDTGFFYCLVKPFNNRELQLTLELVLYKQKSCETISFHEKSLIALLNATKNGLLLLDGDGKIRAINETMAKWAGKSVSSLIWEPMTELLKTEAISPRLAEAIINIHSVNDVELEEEFRGCWFENHICPVIDRHNDLNLIAVYCHDISDRKHTEILLKQANDALQKEKESLLIFRSSLDNMDDVVAVTKPDGEVMYVNHAFERKIGYSLPDMKGKILNVIQAPDDHFALDKNSFIGDTRSVWNGQLMVVNRYKLRIPLLLKSTPILMDERILCRIFVFREKL
jgi:PAS domain S-box-containing protein